MKLHPESLFLESFLDPSPNLPNFLNPNHVLNTLISPGYLHINAHMRHISPLFLPQVSKVPKVGNKMDTKSNEQLLFIEATIEANKQESDKNHKETDEKTTLLTENQKETTETLKLILEEMNIDKNNISKSSPAQKDTSTPPDPTITVQTNRRDTPLEGGISDKIRGMWTLKHEISSPKLYELLIKTEGNYLC